MKDAPIDWAVVYFSLAHTPWSPEERRSMADGVENLLKITGGLSILDVACADGGLAIELASSGRSAA